MQRMSNQVKNMRAVLLMLFAALSLSVSAQTVSITGNVKDATGEPIIGASVVEKGNTTNGTITDLDGNFTLKASSKATLVISYIGMKTQDVALKGQTKIDVTLHDDTQALDEVVVIGYGTVAKKDLTGSVASVSAKDLESIPVTNVSEALTGKLAGVSITTTEGSPDAEIKIRVRGGGSLSQDNSPLYIVDGFPVSSISDIASSDIQSIDVLKDASSTAIYGAKGANGVIIVTTKSGREGKPEVSFGASYGMRKRVGAVGVLSPYEFAMWQQEVDQSGSYYGSFSDLEIYKSKAGTDYQDELFGRTGSQQQYNLSVSGGTKDTKYSVSMARSDEKSIMINSGYERNNISAKVQTKLNKWLTFDFNNRFSYTIIDGLSGGADTQESSKAYSIVARSTIYRPISRLSDELVDEDAGNVDYTPVERTNGTYKQQTRLQNNFNAGVTWAPVKGLKVRSEYGYGWNYRNTDQIWDARASVNSKFGYSGHPQAYLTKQTNQNWRVANTATYDTKNLLVKNDHFNLMIGQEVSSDGAKYTYLTSVNFEDSNTFDQILANMGNGLALPTKTYTNIKDNTSSFFGRLNYTLFDRYLFTVTMRADGSSMFTKGNRWGIFPSAAFAWRLSDEAFMENTKDWLSNLKFRLSYGTSGNNRIDPKYMNLTYALAGTSDKNIYFDENPATVLQHGEMLANPDLKWETTVTRNVGLDFGFWNNRVSGSVDFYWNTTKDLLMRQTIPESTGYKYQYQNIGQTSNKGVEFQTDIVLADRKTWGLNFNFNISYNRGKIDKYPGGSTWESSKWAGTGLMSSEDFLIEEGGRLGEVYGYVYDGFYTTDDLRWTGTSWVLREKEDFAYSPINGTLEPGAMKLKDIDGNGTIDEKDKVRLGNTIHPVSGGFGFNGTFLKNFDFSVFFNYQIGGKLINATKTYSSMYYNSGKHYNLNDNFTLADRYSRIDPATGENMLSSSYANKYINANGEEAYYNKLSEVNAGKSIFNPASITTRPLTSWDVENASFLRLQNVSIGYTLPKTVVKKIHMNNIRLYATAYNILCITKYSGVDPEVDCCTSTPMTPGVDYAAYPKSFSIVGGINVTF